MSVQEAVAAVMEDVQAVRKGDRNQAQGFNFRGIDAVVNAVGPALRRHGVIIAPTDTRIERGQVEVGKNRTLMRDVSLTVTFTVWGPDGDTLTVQVSAEAMDSGDKATSKAHSVAFRTALLQLLCIPTDEPDPDATVYERAAPARSVATAKRAVLELVAGDKAAAHTVWDTVSPVGPGVTDAEWDALLAAIADHATPEEFPDAPVDDEVPADA